MNQTKFDIMPIEERGVFRLENLLTWCGSMVRDKAGICHLLFSLWPQKEGFEAWVTDSVVGHAFSDNPMGPYRYDGIALAGSGIASGWDRDVIHNPTVKNFGDRYYLYYTGNFGNGEFWSHRNNQRVGVAVADSPTGPWQRFAQPLLDVSPDGWDCLLTTNPSVTQMPDGRYCMVYKGVGKTAEPPMYGPVMHGVAFADSPTGPFYRHPTPIFTVDGKNFPGEDPFIFCKDGALHAILKDMGKFYTNQERALVLFDSEDGIDWRLSPVPLVSTRKLRWKQGQEQEFYRLERPQLYQSEDGADILFCAAMPSPDADESFNIHMQIQWK